MFDSFYKLLKSPFSLNPDPDFLFLSAKHKKALTMLERSLANWVGLSVITGDRGTGKSTLIQHLLNKPWPDIAFEVISDADQAPSGLLQRTLSAFGLDSVGKTVAESYELLDDFMVIDSFWQQRQPVLIIDKELDMESGALKELHMLSTIGAEENRNLRIILVQPPSLWEALKMSTWTHLAQCVGASCHLETMNYLETVAYIDYRLMVAGAPNEDLFDVPAYKAIYRYSKGNPRLINVLCNEALVQGAIQKKTQIGASLIKDVIEQQQVLRPVTTASQGQAQKHWEFAEKKLDQTAEVQSNTNNLHLAKHGRTGQTVSEFIISDIDQEARKYARLDAEISKALDESKRKVTGAVHRGRINRFFRWLPHAIVVLVARAIAIFVV